MQMTNNPIYIQPKYSQNQYPTRQQYNQTNRSYEQIQSSFATSRLSQETGKPQMKCHSQKAVQSINQHIYQIVNMDAYTVEANLRNCTNNVYCLINNQLLLSLKNTPTMKLLLYNVLLMYIDEVSNNYQLRVKAKQREKQYSLNKSKNVNNIRQKHLSLHIQSGGQQQGIKQTNIQKIVPLIPKSKASNSQVQMLEEQLSTKIQSTKQSLQNILDKIEHYSNYRLNGQDIMRLKRSVMHVSQLKPSHLLNLHTLNPTPPLRTNPLSDHRKEGKQQRSGNNSRTKTCVGRPGKSSRAQGWQSGAQENRELIEQLQQVIQKKQNRIKQFTEQLTRNLQDQRQLQEMIQNFEVQVRQLQTQGKSLQETVLELQSQNLNYQLQIRQFQQDQTLRVSQRIQQLQMSQKDQTLRIQPHRSKPSPQNNTKQLQTGLKMLRFNISKQFQQRIYPSLAKQQEQRYKDISNIQSPSSAFNDISVITPLRQSKKLLLPTDIDDDYLVEHNVTTTRKNIETQSKQKTKDRSLTRYQIIGDKTQNRIASSRAEMKHLEKQSFQKMLFLQALTIEQLIQDL